MNLTKERACEGKRGHATRGSARHEVRELRAKGVKRLNAYRCLWCPFWHVGHLPYDPPEPQP